MASATTSALDDRDAPLAFMQKVSDYVFFYRPSLQVVRTTAGGDPKAVLVFGWLNAKPQYLAKFVRQYQKLFPGSAILLIRSRLEYLPSPDIARADVEPAVGLLRDFLAGRPRAPNSYQDGLSSGEEEEPEILVHLFSNGGSCILYHLTQLYGGAGAGAGAARAPAPAPLPRRVTILDSAPSPRFAYDEVLAGVASSLPPSPDRDAVQLPAAARLCAALGERFRGLGPGGDYLRRWAGLQNDPAARAREARRLYLFGGADAVSPPRGIERHAGEAEARGFVVRREFFRGSGHVSRSYGPGRLCQVSLVDPFSLCT